MEGLQHQTTVQAEAAAEQEGTLTGRLREQQGAAARSAEQAATQERSLKGEIRSLMEERDLYASQVVALEYGSARRGSELSSLEERNADLGRRVNTAETRVEQLEGQLSALAEESASQKAGHVQARERWEEEAREMNDKFLWLSQQHKQEYGKLSEKHLALKQACQSRAAKLEGEMQGTQGRLERELEGVRITTVELQVHGACRDPMSQLLFITGV